VLTVERKLALERVKRRLELARSQRRLEVVPFAVELRGGDLVISERLRA
jgi:hypothetical protein